MTYLLQNNLKKQIKLISTGLGEIKNVGEDFR